MMKSLSYITHIFNARAAMALRNGSASRKLPAVVMLYPMTFPLFFHRLRQRGLIALAGVCLLHAQAHGATYPLPPHGDGLIGELSEVHVQAGETLHDIARRFGVGINEVMAANPGVDPWLPPAGTRVIVPAQFLLPHGPREGVVVNLPEMRLYYYPPAKTGAAPSVMTFPIGIGSEGRSMPPRMSKIVSKAVDPPWVVPASIRAEHAAQGEFLPKVVPPGPDNPLGRHALRLDFGSYLIHGTNRPFSIGMRVSHGCIRMYPEDIEKLFPEIPAGTPVRIVDQPYKAGWDRGTLYLEAHDPMQEAGHHPTTNLTPVVATVALVADRRLDDTVWQQAAHVATKLNGIPTPILARGGDIPLLQAESAPTPQQGWVYQVGAFANPERAEKLALQIRAMNLPVVSGSVGASGACRVVVGPFDDKDVARGHGERVAAKTGVTGVLLPAAKAAATVACPR